MSERMTAASIRIGLLTALVGALASGGAGCSSDDSFATAIQPDCFSANGCDAGQVCINGVCATPMVPAEISVEVTPSGSSTFVPSQFVDVALDEGPLRLALTPPTRYRVEVLDGQENPVAANVTMFRTDGIPGREIVVDEFIGADRPASLRLLEGTYSVVVRPSEGPGLEVIGFNVRAQLEDDVSKIFQLPAQFRRLYGTVTSARSNQVRLSGVRVRAFGVRSGLASTTAITDASGAFELRLPASTETFFRLQADPPEAQQPAWSYRQTVRVDVDDDRARDIQMTLVNPGDQGTARLQVVGIGVDGTPQPVPGARVTLTATVAGVDIPPVYSVSGTTDLDGLVRVDEANDASGLEIPLIRARYQVEVLSPSDSPFSRRSAVLDLTDAGRGFALDEQISLLPRTEVIGTVRSAGGLPVVEAIVTFEPDEPGLTRVSVVTDLDGRFIARLDPGNYLMVVEPVSAESTFNEFVPVGAQPVAIETNEFGTQALPVYVMPVGADVSGFLTGPTGNAEPNARLEFFIVRSKAVVRLGQAVTDSGGGFDVVLGQP